jgi:hypothetical protein
MLNQTSSTSTQTQGLTPIGASLVTQDITGTVQSVDAASGQVQIRNSQGQTQTFMVDSNVQVSRRNKKAALSTVKRGERITLKPLPNPSAAQ